MQQDRSLTLFQCLDESLVESTVDLTDLTQRRRSIPAESPDHREGSVASMDSSGRFGRVIPAPPAWQFTTVLRMNSDDAIGSRQPPNQCRSKIGLPVDQQVVVVLTQLPGESGDHWPGMDPLIWLLPAPFQFAPGQAQHPVQ